jgi:hypothetical protein
VQLPEAALGARSFGGLGRLERVRVDLSEREVAEGEAKVLAEDPPHLLHDRVGCAAVRALVVAVLDERDAGGCRPPDAVALADGGCEHGAVGRLAHARASACRIDSSAARIPSAPGLTSTGDT